MECSPGCSGSSTISSSSGGSSSDQGIGLSPPYSPIKNTEIRTATAADLNSLNIDLNLTTDLQETLKFHGMFESEGEINHQLKVLNKLCTLLKQWIKNISIQRKISPTIAELFGGKIFTSGSYRLGVHSRGSDIDAVCVVPRHISRAEFFSSFVQVLRRRPEVSNLRAVEDAFVPVIKMTFDNIEMDVLFARLALKEIPDDLEITDDNILKNLDPKCVRSLNACRDTDDILRLVPNEETFRLALRAIKLWAKKRAIYSNVLGYLGGVSWTILVAKICQLYPNALASAIVQKFFSVFSKWRWPQPIFLKAIQPTRDNGFYYWDPNKRVSDRFNVMPIITPAFPQQNSTFNTSLSTKQVMMEEIKRGLNIVEGIQSGEATWDTLFNPLLPSQFFAKYKHYLAVIISSNTDSDQLEWQGLIESNLRHLVGSLGKNRFIQLPHIWPKSINPPINSESGKRTTQWFIGLSLAASKNCILDLTHEISKFTDQIRYKISISTVWKLGMDVEVKYLKRSDLHHYVPPEMLPKKRDGECRGKKRKQVFSMSQKDTTAKKQKISA